jgi:hypothetical protein
MFGHVLVISCQLLWVFLFLLTKGKVKQGRILVYSDANELQKLHSEFSYGG